MFIRRLKTQLLASAVVFALAAVTPVSHASVVYSGPVNINIPNNFDGVYIDFVTGQTATSSFALPGWDFNAYGSNNQVILYFGNSNENDAGLSLDGSTYANLAPGARVGPGSTFILSFQDSSNANFTTGSGGYLGVRFTTPQGTADYGYVHLGLTSGSFPATILDYAYENSGGAITVVPEPGTDAALATLGLGGAGLYTWRRRKRTT